jgi:hypothetical protein
MMPLKEWGRRAGQITGYAHCWCIWSTSSHLCLAIRWKRELDVCHPHPYIRLHSSPLSPHKWSLTLLTFTSLYCSRLLLSLSAEADHGFRTVWPCKMGALRPNLYMHCVFLVLSIPKHVHNCTVVDKHNMPYILPSMHVACNARSKAETHTVSITFENFLSTNQYI